MVSKKLQLAQQYEELLGRSISARERPAYHLTPRIGWLNDPNGFSFYNGQYHLFYQYHPYFVQWGPMHWGHAVSKDLVRWEYLPAALAPDQEWDKDGCFSGSALETADGKHLLMYTGVRKEPGPWGNVQEYQTQCLAAGDGLAYEKWPGGPVIGSDLVPEGFSRRDFRDPKIWQEADGSFACVAAILTDDGSGAAVLYRSPDCIHWHFCTIVDRSSNCLGTMWECPDFFPLDGKQILVTCPIAMPETHPEYRNHNGTVALIGTWEADRFSREQVQSADYGFDFYAPQSMLSPDGRRILIGWMQNPCSSQCPPHAKWMGQLTAPRELHVHDGRLIQMPIAELEQYRGSRTAYEKVILNGALSLPGICGRVLDMNVTVEPGQDCTEVRIELAKGGTYRTELSYDPKSGLLTLCRAHSGFTPNEDCMRSCTTPGGRLKLRILLDRCSVEIFVNDGQQVMSAVIYTPEEAQEITFASTGHALLDAEKYDLEF